MNLSQLRVLIWLGLANLSFVSFGGIIGIFTTFVTRPPRAIRNILAVAPAIGHANSIPLMLAPHICSLYSSKFSTKDAETAEAYIGLYLIMHTFTLWGIGLNVIRKPNVILAVAGQGNNSVAPDAVGKPNTSTRDDAAQSVDETDAISLDQISLDEIASASVEMWAEAVSSMETGAPPPKPQRKRPGCSPLSIYRFVPEWFNKPMAACLLAVAIGMVPPLQALLVEDDGALNVPFAAMQRIGSATPVLALLGNGAAFVADGLPTISLVGYRPLAGLIIGRLLLLPACALLFWMCLRRSMSSLFPQDPVFMLIVGIECSMPSAFNIITMCTLQGVGEREMSGALFYQYLVALFTMTSWVTVVLLFVV